LELVVNGQRIPREVCDAEIQRVRAVAPELGNKEAREEVRNRLVREALLLQNARVSGIKIPGAEVEEEYQRLMAEQGGEEAFYLRAGLSKKHERRVRHDVRERLLVGRFVDSITSGVPPPRQGQVDRFLQEHRDELVHPAKVHASHIVKAVDRRNPASTYREMLAIRRRLTAGEDFAEVANQQSGCRDPGGDLGHFSPGQMVEEFDAVVFSMSPGEISPVFLSPFGYHIAAVWESSPDRPMSDTEAEETANERVLDAARQSAVESWVRDKRARAVIEEIG
jgi:parvulin-like peptidyl-prolyl isomerase